MFKDATVFWSMFSPSQFKRAAKDFYDGCSSMKKLVFWYYRDLFGKSTYAGCYDCIFTNLKYKVYQKSLSVHKILNYACIYNTIDLYYRITTGKNEMNSENSFKNSFKKWWFVCLQIHFEIFLWKIKIYIISNR